MQIAVMPNLRIIERSFPSFKQDKAGEPVVKWDRPRCATFRPLRFSSAKSTALRVTVDRFREMIA
jgi:hypothetical protein